MNNKEQIAAEGLEIAVAALEQAADQQEGHIATVIRFLGNVYAKALECPDCVGTLAKDALGNS